jgi:6-phosphofructokinase 1
VGIVRLSGRYTGFLAMEASFASRSVNICLIPEFSFDLYGKRGLINYIF